MCEPAKVQWPGGAYDSEADDLSAPITRLLRDLRLLETAADERERALLTTPQSLQVITAGATALTKVWAGLVGALGGGGAIFAAVKGLGAGSGDTPLQRAVFVASAALLVAVAALSVAIIIRGDVAARATASAAEYRARADVAVSLIAGVQHARPQPPVPPAASAPPREAAPACPWAGTGVSLTTAPGAGVDPSGVTVVVPACWRAPAVAPQQVGDSTRSNGDGARRTKRRLGPTGRDGAEEPAAR